MKPSPEKDMSITANHGGGYSYRELEAAVDIALNAGSMMAQSKILIHDSRALVLFIVNAAQQFESVFKGDDYIATVDSFAERELKAAFGSAPAPQPEQDAGEWRLAGFDHTRTRRDVCDQTGATIAQARDVETAEQIVRDHRSAAAVPKLVEALKRRVSPTACYCKVMLGAKCGDCTDRELLATLTTVNQTGGEK